MAGTFAATNLSAFWVAHECTQDKFFVIQLGKSGYRKLTPPLQGLADSTLCQNTNLGVFVVERPDQGFNPRIIPAAFNADRTLADGRHHLFYGQTCANALLEAKTFQPGDCQQNGVIIPCVQSGKPGTDIATQKLDLEPWK